jgi:hypothetical protein
MKKVILLLMLLLSTSFVFAESACSLDITLLNQDPYPAVPGDYVKLVFQIDGTDDPACNDITFTLPSEYPVEFNPGETGIRTFKKVDYIRDYGSNILIPYEVRINKDAINGANPIDILIQSKGGAKVSKTFNIEVEDVRADFETYISNFDYTTNELTLGILNIEQSDIEALVVKIPKQDNVIIKGANQMIVGDLDSNEYTTADFEAMPSNGEITLELTYSDTINTRRTITKTVTFDSSYFTDRKSSQKSGGAGNYILLGVILVIISWIVFRKIKKKKKK